MTTQEKIEILIPLLENADKDIDSYRNAMLDTPQNANAETDKWYKHFIKLLVGETIIAERTKTVLENLQPPLEESYINTLIQEVTSSIIFEQCDKIYNESVDPAIKRTAKKLYNSKKIKSSNMITTKKEFKLYYNLKRDSRLIKLAPDCFYFQCIKDRLVEFRWYSNEDNENFEMSEKIKYPFSPKEYEEFEKKIQQRANKIIIK